MDRDDSASESEFLTAYVEADDVNAKYRLLRREATRFRQRAVRPDDVKFTDDPAVMKVIRACKIESMARSRLRRERLRLAGRAQGRGNERLQEDVGLEPLREEYEPDPELDRIRRTILKVDPWVHQVLVARHDGDRIDYHLPGGWRTNTGFLTVREALGLVDYIPNGHQREAMLY